MAQRPEETDSTFTVIETSTTEVDGIERTRTVAATSAGCIAVELSREEWTDLGIMLARFKTEQRAGTYGQTQGRPKE